MILLPYELPQLDSLDGARPHKAHVEERFADILASCAGDQVERAILGIAPLYPPLVLGLACVPTIQN